jgi:hypothetical protein
MRLNRIRAWLIQKWGGGISQALAQDYAMTFSTGPGHRVLRHLVDSVYCTVYEGVDPVAATALNARRSVVHEILYNIDVGENPAKYSSKQPVTEEKSDAIGSPASELAS